MSERKTLKTDGTDLRIATGGAAHATPKKTSGPLGAQGLKKSPLGSHRQVVQVGPMSYAQNRANVLQASEDVDFLQALDIHSNTALTTNSNISLNDPRETNPLPNSKEEGGKHAGRRRKMFRQQRDSTPGVYTVSIAALFVVVVSFGVYSYLHSDVYVKYKEKRELHNMLEQVASIVLITNTESSSVFTVTDPLKIREQNPLFDKLEKGDHVIYYKDDKLIVLYSKLKKKISAVFPMVNSTTLPAQ